MGKPIKRAIKSIWDIRQMMGLKKDITYPKMERHEGTFSTGGFEGIHDYGAGILGVVMGSVHDGNELYLPYVTVYTIDDGGWQAFSVNPMPLEDCNVIIKSIADKWDYGTVLPSEDDLNVFLSEFGMWGECTG